MAVYRLAIGDVVDFPMRLAYTDGGQAKTAAFRLQGQRMSEPELRDLRSRDGQTVADLLVEKLSGWEGQSLVLDAAGAPAEFSADALRCLLSLPGAANAVFAEYVKAIGVEGKRGN